MKSHVRLFPLLLHNRRMLPGESFVFVNIVRVGRYTVVGHGDLRLRVHETKTTAKTHIILLLLYTDFDYRLRRRFRNELIFLLTVKSFAVREDYKYFYYKFTCEGRGKVSTYPFSSHDFHSSRCGVRLSRGLSHRVGG